MSTLSIFSPACICFPQNEHPGFGFPIEREIAGRVRCPQHGERFTPQFHLYVPKWLREKYAKRLTTFHSEQYRKAWFASFPPELWPAEEEETETGKIFLKLKDGSMLLAYEPAWKRHGEAVGERDPPVPLSSIGTQEQQGNAVQHDNILRYESHVNGALYRATEKLERLQRQSKGHAVSLPLNINLEKWR